MKLSGDVSTLLAFLAQRMSDSKKKKKNFSLETKLLMQNGVNHEQYYISKLSAITIIKYNYRPSCYVKSKIFYAFSLSNHVEMHLLKLRHFSIVIKYI